MRLLFVTPFPPRLDGAHGGSRTIGRLVAGLAGRHRTAVVALRRVDDEPVDDRLRGMLDLYIEVQLRRPRRLHERALHRAHLRGQLARGVPLAVSENHATQFRSELQRVTSEWQPDVVQIEFDVMAQYASALDRSPARRLLVVHEPGLVSAGEGREASSRLLRRLELRAWRRYSQTAFGEIDAGVVFTERDRLALAGVRGRTPLAVVAPGVDIAPAPRSSPDSSSLLFVGNFVHPPNTEAALRLARTIFPLVRSRVPGSTLAIVGSGPPVELEALGGDAIDVTGYVPDVRPLLDEAAVVVAPLSTGGGIRIKVLEALGAGKAVVASPLAVEGLTLPSEQIVVVAESDAEFADEITALLQDPEARMALGERARRWAETNLRWDETEASYERIYSELLSDPAAE